MKSSIKKYLGLALLILVAANAQPAMSAFWQWSKTASVNAGADPSINWAEGMSPSSVNDSARAMMARAAEYRDDISGLLTTGGTATAYTVTTNQGLAATPNDGQQLAITPNATNGMAATLTADGGTSFPIQSSPGVAIGGATLIAGTPYTLKFSTASSAWMLSGFYGSALTIPLGAMVPYTLATVPNSNFVFPAGQCLSTTTYSAYWVAKGSPASGVCPGGQFQIIDVSGRAPVGLDTMPGFSAANRLTASANGCGTAMTSVGAICANGNESQTLTIAQMPSHFHAAGIFDPGHTHGVSSGIFGSSGLTFNYAGAGGQGGFGAGIVINAAATGVRVTSSNGLDTTYSNGSNGPHPIVLPVVGVTYLLRVL